MKNPTPAFWSGRRVFMTGHTGFKGAWLSHWLLEMGAEVTGYSLPAPTQPSLYEITNLKHQMTSIEGDIRNPGDLSTAMAKSNPEIVIHMAAQPLVRESYKTPVDTFETNVMGTIRVLEATRTQPEARVALMITTDKCYENRERPEPYREEEAMGGHDPYSSSKGCAELAIAAWRNSFFTPEGKTLLASARAGNVIGGGDWATDRLVTDVVTAFLERRAVKIRSPRAVRPWQHVLEPLSGYLVLIETLANKGKEFCGGWNFGPRPEDHVTVEKVVSRLATLWGKDAHWSKDEGDHPHEATLLRLDISRAQTQLDWSPRWPLDTSLQKLVDWYRTFANNPPDCAALTRKQIQEYSA